MKDNNYKYGRYINRDQETRWATPEEIRRSGTFVDLNDEQYPVAGLPLLSDAKTAYVDGEDTHTLIFGATGSKKTRLFCMPMLNFFSKAGESFIATDPKGELFSKTSGIAKANGYKVAEAEFGWYNPRRYIVMNQARRFGNICQLFGWKAWTTDCVCAVCRKRREKEVKEAMENA